ncbi:MAG: TldD/PmbA family protein [Myxococcales bacterium]|nr:TldD/PmbA family protein [Myxococcales bacterium]
MRALTTCVALSLLLSVRLGVAAQPAPRADYRLVLMAAMKQELQRNMRSLRLDDHPSPYFISYALRHTEYREVEARNGAIYARQNLAFRKVDVDLRVGSYDFDNSVSKDPDVETYDYYRPSDSAPLTNDPQALRRTFWLQSDFLYKQALINYLALRGKRVFNASKKLDGGVFSRERPTRSVAPLTRLEFDEKRFTALALRLSQEVLKHKALFDSKIEISGRRAMRIFVSSEGTEVITERTMYTVSVNAVTRAADGMLLKDSVVLYSFTPRELADDARILSATRRMIADLLALREAPVLPPFTGPAILMPQAAGVFFHETIGHRLEGHRNLGDQSGQTFKDKINQEILPSFLSIVDDPTLRRYGSGTVNGYYRYDEEGVPSRRVVLVDRGVLRGFLMSRRPVAPFLRSNGHGRSAGSRSAVARMSNLIIRSTSGIPYAKLKALLLAETRRQKKPFGLIIKNIVGGSTNTSAYGYQAFKGIPKMVYKVDARTGKETLVRGVEFVGTPLSSINKIIATSDQYGVFNGYCGAESGYVPVSTIAPAMLFREIELQRSLKKKERGILLPPP